MQNVYLLFLFIIFSIFFSQAYLFNDYWEDIGTIRSFFEANLALTQHVSAISHSYPSLLGLIM